MVKHYWVSSPEVGAFGDPYKIVHCVEASSKKLAKSQFIKIERDNKTKGLWRDNWISECGSDNPFVGLEVSGCMCKHSVCNCELDNCTLGNPKDPDHDYCGDCVKEGKKEQWMEEYNALYTGVRTPIEIIKNAP